MSIPEEHPHSIAIIGMAGRFPGAHSVEEFWTNLCQGVESIRPVTADDLRLAGLDPSILEASNYVAMCAPLDDAECFDAAFFGYLPREAAIIDPQQRLLLECAWAALEDAGYDPLGHDGLTGVFAGVAPNTYAQYLYQSRPEVLREAGDYQAMIASEKDFPATRIGYKLNLGGPCVNVQTACSTSGVALHLACQALLTGDVDTALAGGARVLVPHRAGYFFEDGGILSPDGRCRPFDASAAGTFRASGGAFVVLKRYEDAVADGDTIHAVIRGTATNNDGNAKAGFTAPSVRGQTAVIVQALSLAGVDAGSIGYVEAHGTGTRVGDPIELTALTKAFRATSQGVGYCGIGSVKSNIGHLDAGAAVAGLIKATLAVKHGVIPPSLHFRNPNPQLGIEESPFFVVDALREWTTPGVRRAGVSSFGLGGTNAHIVIEQPPPASSSSPARVAEILPISGRTRESLETVARDLANRLEAQDQNLGDVALTLQTGRRRQARRQFVVAGTNEEAVAALRQLSPGTVARGLEDSSLVFMFPGGGAQYPGMGAGLFASEPVYREHLSRCLAHLRDQHDIDLSDALLPAPEPNAVNSASALAEPSRALTALFSVEVSVARLLMSWGLIPQAMIGHSLGEYAAAHLAGVVSLEDAIALVAHRGRLFESAPRGSMLSVPLPEADLRRRFPDLSIAAVNKPDLCILSGEDEDIDRAEKALSEEGIDASRLHIAVPAHSEVLAPILGDFADFVSAIPLNPPQVPFVSNVTGDWIRADEATDPEYWVRHLRQTVRFDQGLGQVLSDNGRALVEVGPGRSLSGLARQHASRERAAVITPSMRHPKEGVSDVRTLLNAVGRLWMAGVSVDWRGFHGTAVRKRVSLPTYPFARARHWIEPGGVLGRDKVARAPDASVPSQLGNEAAEERSDAQLTQPDAPEAQRVTRYERLLDRVKRIFGQLSGLSPDEIDEESTFLDLGFESLSLTQGSMAIKSEFSVELSFRQLLEGFSTPALLARHLDESLPAEVLKPEEPNSARTADPANNQIEAGKGPAKGHGEISIGDVRDLFAEQLRIMSRQLEVLESGRKPQSGRTSDRSVSEGLEDQGPKSAVRVSPAPPLAEAKGPWRPIDQSLADGLGRKREQHLNDLVARLNARTRESKRWTQRNRAHLADPRTVAGFRRTWKELVYPLVVSRSKGSRLWDLDGNEYVDVAMGFGVNLFGHSPDFIMNAVRDRLDQGVEIGPQTPLAGEVAELIAHFSGHERVAFANTGSEAVLAAIRMARTVTGRQKIVTFDGDYHGIFDEVLAKPVPSSNGMKSVPVAPGIPQHMVDSIVALPYGDPASLAQIEGLADDLALVLVEPVQSRHPDLQPVEFLRSLRDLTTRLGVPLVFDEMITGFRCHPGGAQTLFGVQADIATYGKVIGGGFPIGVVAGKAEYMDALDGGMWSFGDDSFPQAGVTWFAGTFVRHPVALTASRAALLHMMECGPDLQETLNRRTSEFVAELNAHYNRIGVPIHLEHFSSLFLVTFQSHREFSSLFYHHLRDHGVHITEGRSAFLSTAHSDEDLEHLLNAFKASAHAMQVGGFLPGEASTSIPPRSEPAAVRVPVTEAQEEIWLAAAGGLGAECAFNLSNRLGLNGPLDRSALSMAFEKLVERHEALRTTFSEDGTEMVVSRRSSMPFTEVDLSGLKDPEDELRRLALDDVEAPFDLVSGPLARAQLIRMAEDRHVLFLTVHHIVCDGWSCGVLLRDLGALYSAHIDGRTPNLPDPMQISEYARAQDVLQQSPRASEVESYWVDQFADGIPVLDLPTDRPRPALKTYCASREELDIPQEIVAQLKALGTAHGSTLFTLLLSAFEVFLSRLTGQTDFVVGVSAAGQLAAGNPNLVGHCVSLLPIRARVDPVATFAEHLLSTRERILDSFEHQDFTFGTLLKKISVPRDPSRLPVVDVVFNMDSAMSGLKYAGLSANGGSNPRVYENFDLFVNVVTTDAGTRVECTHNTDLLDSGTIRRRLQEFGALLSGLAATPEAKISDLPLLTDDERHRLLVEWNETAIDFPEDISLADLFESQVRKSPDAEAVVVGNTRTTYRQLNEEANRIAHKLRSAGVGPEVLVGICLGRGPRLLPAILGVLKAGGGYVPLDPEYPAARLGFMLDDCVAPVILTETSLSHQFIGHKGSVIVLDQDDSAFDDYPSADPDRTGTSEDVAYVIYTSGSTGVPKGVVIENRNVVALLFWAYTVFEPDELRGVLFATSICFDLSVFEMMLPLTTGGRIILAENVIGLPDLPASREVTLVNTVPSAMAELVRAGWIPDGVQTVCLAGEPLSSALVDEIYEKTSATRVYDLYGPSEDTVYSTWARRERNGPNTIGRPIANTRAYVLDRNRKPLPIGIPGELYLGGAGVARGYLGRPDLTAERFVPDPFAGANGGKMYRTGDIVRYMPDGRLHFLGRRDNQVKLRGFRIELAEIEAALVEHDDVAEALVVVRELADQDQRLIAYVVPSDGTKPPAAELLSFVAERLPGYMVPSAIVTLPEFPRLPNGKLDRSRLPAPAGVKSLSESSSAAAPAPVERSTLGEIEAALVAHEDVQQAVVAVRGNGSNSRLVGYVVFEDGADTLGSELRAFLRTRLPDDMVPGVITELDRLPLTPNGNIDRDALPNPFGATVQRDFIAPQTELEKQIADIWCRLLKVDRVGLHDNFFELGGHSLLAVRAVALISTESSRRVDPRSFFFQSLGQIASSLQN